jgi:hypothetical protein
MTRKGVWQTGGLFRTKKEGNIRESSRSAFFFHTSVFLLMNRH